MRLLTGSFYYRTAARLFVGTLVSVVLLVGIGWLLVGKPMVQHSAMIFAKEIQNAADNYRLLRESQRPEFLAYLHRDQALTLEPAASTLTGKRPHLPYFIYLEEAISEVSGQPVRLLRRGKIYSFDFSTRDTRLRFHFNENRIGAAPVLALSTMMVVALLWSLLTAVLIGKYTALPIETIAQRTEARYDSGLFVPIPEEGPRELREIVRNFNQINSQNRDLINNSSIMLAGISHDLRAPITRARMALELARGDMDESLALRIERALIQMDTLIAQYLDFTGGSVKEGASPLSIPALLKEISQTYKPSEIRLDISSGDVVVYLPSRAFIRCAQNLIDNAVKHSGGAPIDVKFQKIASVWTLEIADRGPGIPAAQLDRVFQPFLRLDNARTQMGSGLGLSIVQEICRVQGWFISLLPRPGGGLIARLNLPVAVQS